MPLSPKSTGFSDNGLSYEVAGDYNKLLGQALANYEARTSNPRSYQESDADYATRVGSASGILGNELAPLEIGNSLAATVLNHRASQPRIVKSGQDIFMEQPGAQGLTMVHQGAHPPAKMTDAQKWEADTVRNDIARTQKLIDGISGNKQSDIDTKYALENKLVDLKRRGRSLFALPDLTQQQSAPVAGQVAAAPVVPQGPAPTPYAFMGVPGSTNLIQGSLGQQPAPAVVRPGQRGVRILGIRPAQ